MENIFLFYATALCFNLKGISI